MIAYLDSSVFLRFVLGQVDVLKEWRSVTHPLASALVKLECLRTLDRVRLRGGISVEDLATTRSRVFHLLRSVELLDVSEYVLDRASQPFPTSLGTLDAIHLATALLWKESHAGALFLATHDSALATAGRACGLTVIGG